MECQRCFYLDNKLGVARPPGFPLISTPRSTRCLKKSSTAPRQRHSASARQSYGLDAVPLAHAKMDEWRDALRHGVKCVHKATGLTVRGGVDDIWVNKDGELIVIDYKATSKDGKIESLDEEWHRGYKRQLEVYQWLLRQNGFKVSDTGYWFYANASKDREAFDGRLDFELTLGALHRQHRLGRGHPAKLKGVPRQRRDTARQGADCDYCRYREAAGKA
jgi:hypothetical protein